MKKIFLVTLIILLSTKIYSQGGFYEWAKKLEGIGSKKPYTIKTDTSGNIYTTGSFGNTIDFDPGIGVYNLITTGSYDIFIQKLDSDGNFIWAKSIGGSGPNNDGYGISLAIDNSENVYITGFFEGTVDFNPGSGTFNLTSNGGRDIFILKLDPNGNFVWAGNIGDIYDDTGIFITVDNSSNVYVTGTFARESYLNNAVDFDIGTGIYNLSCNGYSSMFFLKLDNNGNFIWAKEIGNYSQSSVNSLSIDNLGNMYATGNFYSTLDFNPGSGTYNLTGAIFILKLDINGNFSWAKSIDGFDLTGFSIATDNFGNIYTSGNFRNTIDFDPGAGVFNLTSTGGDNIFIQKLDVNGNFIWAKMLDASYYSYAGYDNYGDILSLDKLGNIYTTGVFTGTVDFDPGTGVTNLTSNGSSGYKDLFILNIDPNGNLIWVKALDGLSVNSVNATSITVDKSLNVHILGNFEHTIDFDPGLGTAPLTSLSGTFDIFILKLSYISTLPEPPEVIINSSSGDYNTNIIINYSLIDANSDTCYIDVKYSLDNGSSWSLIPGDNGGDGLIELSALPIGVNHQFIWTPKYYRLDVGSCPGNDKNVLIKITPYDFTVGQSDETIVNLSNNLIDSVACDWEQLNSGVGDYLQDVFFLNNDTGFVSGVGGTFIKTTNQGITWSVINLGTLEWLNSLFFTDNLNGVIVGANGYLVRTNNGGTTWQIINSGTSDWLFSVFFPSNQIGYAVGGGASGVGQVILKTIDGGLTWNNQNIANSSQLRSVHFLNDNVGYASGYNATIIKTTDGGLNWIPLNTNLPLYYTLNSVHFTSIDTGYAGGGWQIGSNNTQAIIKTVDGGVTWTNISSLNNDFINDIISIGPSRLIAVGYNGTLLKSTDGGVNWEIRNSTDNLALHSSFFVDENLGFSVGSTGKIIITNQNIIGINEVENKEKEFRLFPNPTSSKLIFDNNNLSIKEINIIDITGIKIKTIKQNLNAIDVSNLPSGIYFIQVITEDMIVTKKFVKQ